MDRRRYLTGITTTAALGLAGCSSDTSVSNPDESGTDTGDRSAGTFSLNETAIFRSGDGEELSYTPVGARVDDVLLYQSGSSIYSTSPDSSDRVYLSVEIEAENTGSESVDLPQSPTVQLSGTQYESTTTRAYGENEYDPYQEVRPGATTGGWIVYPIEYAESTAKLSADFQSFSDVATAEWEFEVSDLVRRTYDRTGLNLREAAEISTGDHGYLVMPTEVEETQSYEYGSSYTFTEEAGTGNKFVLVTLQSENTGEGTISIPTSRDISLRAGSSQYEAENYRKDNEEYDGGDIAPGIVREGVVQFEVDESVSAYELQVRLTDDITATWNL